MYFHNIDPKIKLKPLKRSRLAQEVSEQLRNQIYEGVFKQGDKLPSVDVLSEAFKVGKPVVREATQLLQNSGLVFVKPGAGGGAFVEKLDARNLSEAFEAIIRLDSVSMDEFTESRLVVELNMLTSTVQRINAQQIKELERNVITARENLEKGVEDFTNIEFHVLLARANGNGLLIKIIEAFAALGMKFSETRGFSHKRYERIVEDHEDFLILLKEKKYEELVARLEGHIKYVGHSFE